MKKLNVFVLGLLALVIVSCSNDDNEEIVNNDLEINQQEETVLDETMVLDNLKIEGAVKKSGTPTPNGAISFQLDNPSSSAFLKNGFEINFNNTSDTFVGAYLQIKSTDGTVADGYWDIGNISAKNRPSKIKETTSKQSTSSKINLTEGSISVNFLDAITPGKFCYVICVYNSSGDISNPIEVCVEVENWGGNSELIGSWELLSQEYIENGVSEGELNVGDEGCYDGSSFYCDSAQIFVEYETCSQTDLGELILNENGTYSFREEYTYDNFDYELSELSCTAVLVDETGYYLSEGKWAYNEEENILTLIEFSWNEDGYEGTEVDGYVYLTGPGSVTNNILIIDDRWDDGSYVEEYIVKFSRK